MTTYRFNVIKRGWHAPWVFESELRDDAAAFRELRALQAVYTLAGEPPCQVKFEPRWAPDPEIAQGRWVIVDWSVPGAGLPEMLGLPLAGGFDQPRLALDTVQG